MERNVDGVVEAAPNLQSKKTKQDLENALDECLSDALGLSRSQEAESNESLDVLSKLMELRKGKENLTLMITGPTGAGKTSTVNALFNTEAAAVGAGVDPDTEAIQEYVMDKLVVLDTPGLGESPEADNRHAQAIRRKLRETDEDGKAVVDAVLVLADAGSRDMSSVYELLDKVLLPEFRDSADRIIVGINQADMLLGGRYWNAEKAIPEEKLAKALEEKAESVRERILEYTGRNLETVVYAAGYTEADGKQEPSYNIGELFEKILISLPDSKRLVCLDNISKETGKELWQRMEEYENAEAVKPVFYENKAFMPKGCTMPQNRYQRLFGYVFGTIISIVLGKNLKSMFDKYIVY